MREGEKPTHPHETSADRSNLSLNDQTWPVSTGTPEDAVGIICNMRCCGLLFDVAFVRNGFCLEGE